MCGRYVIVESIESIEKRFNAETRSTQYQPNYNVAPGQIAPVITSDNPNKVQMFKFGLTPSWAKKQMYLINARSEGDHNKEDNPRYNGAKGIILKPAFRKQIRSQRCLVIASAFIEGPRDLGLSKPYLIYLKDKKRPFALAGIWDVWHDDVKDETVHSFAIITTTANELLQKVGHHRMPVILDSGHELEWLNANTELGRITHLLEPYPAEQMNAYPISPLIKNPKNNSRELIEPVGERVEPEKDYNVVTKVVEKGWGRRKKHFEDDLPTIAERHKKIE